MGHFEKKSRVSKIRGQQTEREILLFWSDRKILGLTVTVCRFLLDVLLQEDGRRLGRMAGVVLGLVAGADVLLVGGIGGQQVGRGRGGAGRVEHLEVRRGLPGRVSWELGLVRVVRVVVVVALRGQH